MSGKEVSVLLTGTVKWFNNEKGYGFIQFGDLKDISFIIHKSQWMDIKH